LEDREDRWEEERRGYGNFGRKLRRLDGEEEGEDGTELDEEEARRRERRGGGRRKEDEFGLSSRTQWPSAYSRRVCDEEVEGEEEVWVVEGEGVGL
jgi:hypothetical protein